MKIEFNKLIGIAHEKGDSALTITIFLGMRAIKINFWAKARNRPTLYYYSHNSMKFIYENWNLSFSWFCGAIVYHKIVLFKDTDLI